MATIILNRFWGKYGITPEIYLYSIALVLFIISVNALYLFMKYGDFKLFMLDKGILILCGYILLMTTGLLIRYYLIGK